MRIGAPARSHMSAAAGGRESFVSSSPCILRRPWVSGTRYSSFSPNSTGLMVIPCFILSSKLEESHPL